MACVISVHTAWTHLHRDVLAHCWHRVNDVVAMLLRHHLFHAKVVEWQHSWRHFCVGNHLGDSPLHGPQLCTEKQPHYVTPAGHHTRHWQAHTAHVLEYGSPQRPDSEHHLPCLSRKGVPPWHSNAAMSRPDLHCRRHPCHHAYTPPATRAPLGKCASTRHAQQPSGSRPAPDGSSSAEHQGHG